MSSTSIEKLTGGNWLCWRMWVQAHLAGEGLWDQVDRPYAGINEVKKTKAYAFIVCHCSEAIVVDLYYQGFHNNMDPAQVWKYLAARFEPKKTNEDRYKDDFKRSWLSHTKY